MTMLHNIGISDNGAQYHPVSTATISEWCYTCLLIGFSVWLLLYIYFMNSCHAHAPLSLQYVPY